MAILKKIQRFFGRNKDDPQSVSTLPTEPSSAAKVDTFDYDQLLQNYEKIRKKKKIASVVFATSAVCILILGLTLGFTVNINCVYMIYLITLMMFAYDGYSEYLSKKL